MSWKSRLLVALRSLLSMVAAWVAFWLGTMAGGELAALANLPPGGGPRLAWDLAWVALGGALAAWCVVAIAPCARRLHVLAFFAMLLAIAVLAVARLGSDWPWWFDAGALAVPLLSAWLGLRRVARIEARRSAQDQAQRAA
jgi:hypothetical protein